MEPGSQVPTFLRLWGHDIIMEGIGDNSASSFMDTCSHSITSSHQLSRTLYIGIYANIHLTSQLREARMSEENSTAKLINIVYKNGGKVKTIGDFLIKLDL